MRNGVLQLLLLSSLSLILLSGCSSGGGNPKIDAGDLVFKKWSEVPTSGAVIIGGTTQIENEAGTHDSNTIIAYEDGSIVKIEMVVDDTKVIWDTRTGDTIDESGSVINIYSGTDPTNKDSLALMGNPTHHDNDWEYQTYGAWMTGRTAGTSTFNSVSMGAQTPGSDIPKLNSAEFTGSAGGIYIDSSANDYTVSANMTMDVNFQTRKLTFETTGSRKTAVGGPTTDAANLNMSGDLSYAANINKFTGTVTATDLSGTSTGHFYGPKAEEVGGVFNLQGAGGEYVGAYGGIK